MNDREVAGETIDGEVILVRMDRGHYYNLQGTGAAVWQGVERGLSRDEIVSEMSRLYDGDNDAIAHGVDELLDRLLAEGIIVAADVPTTKTNADLPEARDPAPRIPFLAPVLGKHTDMEDLLTLDPIHDVDEAGWPSRRGE
jgi:hypothetical protein